MIFRAHPKVSVVAFICTLLSAVPAKAHPMGNFSINHYARIEVHSGEVELRYVLDLAEIPTYQEMQRAGISADSDAAATERYVAEQSMAVRQGLQLRVAGRHLALREVAHQILFSAGAGGLLTMKLGFTFRALVPRLAGTQALEYEDENFRERTGWKEIVCETGTLQSSSGCHPERSHELSSYSADLINSPPQDTEAKFFFKVLPMQSKSPDLPTRVAAEWTIAPGQSAQAAERNAQAPAAAPALKPNPAGTPRSAFTALNTRRDRGLWFFVFAALVALGLGALHALEPGHGKTMVAAYLVGSHGTPAHAVLLGLVVPAAHTAGVYLLGAVTLCASGRRPPQLLT